MASVLLRYVTEQMTKSFYKEIKRMQWSLDRREVYVSEDTPVCEVNWDRVFDNLSPDITVSDLYELLDDFEILYGEVEI